MVRSVASAFFEELQLDRPRLTDLIQLSLPTETLRWTTYNRSVVSSGQTYEPFPGGATGGGVEESIDLGISVLNFMVANSAGFFDRYIKANALSRSEITIDRVVVNSPDLDRMNRYWGNLADLTHNRLAITGQARNVFDSVTRQWPYYTYTDACQWRFGGIGCAFDVTSIEFAATIESSSKDGLILLLNSGTITASLYVDDFFRVGRSTFSNNQNSGYYRMIRAQSGDMLELTHRVPFAPTSGDTIDLRHGCKKRFVDDCTSLFNNTSNFLGFPWIPKQSDAF